MNILITGGCGFIGSNFVRRVLTKYDYTIVNLDALTYAGNLENLKEFQDNQRYTFIHGKIEDSKMVNEILKKESITHIVHFAAESHVDRSIVDSAPFIKTNIEGTRVLLDAAKANDIKKFVHISTDEVYGSLGETGLFTENTPLAPNSPYSASKAGADLLVRAYKETYQFPVVIIRCSNNYGPYQFPEKFIPLVISNAIHDEKVPLYGDGLNVRDWIYVEDFCSAIDTVLHKGVAGEVYNAGGRAEKKNIDVLHTILKILGKPESLIKYVEDRKGHDRRYAMDIAKINKEFGWVPAVTFEQGIEKTIQWYVNNAEWWKHIKSGEYRKYYEEMYGKRLEARS